MGATNTKRNRGCRVPRRTAKSASPRQQVDGSCSRACAHFGSLSPPANPLPYAKRTVRLYTRALDLELDDWCHRRRSYHTTSMCYILCSQTRAGWSDMKVVTRYLKEAARITRNEQYYLERGPTRF